MPIKIPDGLPAKKILIDERVSIIDESTAIRQDIRPLDIALINLMPDKIPTETQIARVLGATSLQIQLTLLRTATYTGTHTDMRHLLGFYKTLDDVRDAFFDGVIVTGAPVEHLPFKDVAYWDELTGIMDWAAGHSYSQFYICWGAQAALNHFYGITPTLHQDKFFGVYPHPRRVYTHPLTRGFDDIVHIPVSRYTRLHAADIENHAGLTTLLSSDDVGPGLMVDDRTRRVFMVNHLEYDGHTLHDEYRRDIAKRPDTPPPANYFPGNDLSRAPVMNWRAHRNLLFSNWINMVYQGTPYDLSDLKKPAKIEKWN